MMPATGATRAAGVSTSASTAMEPRLQGLLKGGRVVSVSHFYG
jgi:hypothetical protein